MSVTPPNDVEPRLARAGEDEALRNLVEAAYGHYVARLGKKPGPMLDNYAERIARKQAWVLETGGGLVAVMVLEPAGDALLLDNIAVSPQAQGRGFGRSLIAFAERRARSCGATELRLYTNVLMTENIQLYSRLGFDEIERRSENGFERVYMVKALPNCP